MKNLDELAKETNDINIPTPLFYKDFLGVSLFVWMKPELRLEVCETEPYERDGAVPLIFAQFGFFELMFYNHTLYNILYKRKKGYLPEVLNEKND